MLTFFTTPKPFQGRLRIIQRNTIESWTWLKPKPEIILFDETEEGKEIAKEFGLCYISEIKKNEYGTPLVSSIFEIAQKEAKHPIVCYVNADIILLNNFIKGIEKAIKFMEGRDFLLVGRRWNVNLSKEWNFGDKDWEKKLQLLSKENGYQESAGAVDYFVFPKNISWNIPPFAIGRCAWDGWFLWQAKRKKVPIIDATEVITIFHQRHDYSNWRSGQNIWQSEEFKRNQKLRGSFQHQYNILDADYLLSERGLEKPSKIRKLEAEILRLKMQSEYYLRSVFYPYSYPLILLSKCLKKILSQK